MLLSWGSNPSIRFVEFTPDRKGSLNHKALTKPGYIVLKLSRAQIRFASVMTGLVSPRRQAADKGLLRKPSNGHLNRCKPAATRGRPHPAASQAAGRLEHSAWQRASGDFRTSGWLFVDSRFRVQRKTASDWGGFAVGSSGGKSRVRLRVFDFTARS